MVKKGDTLIEVTLAIGIFSMIAVAIAAVLGSSTSGAQTALEATLAREEIDTQAEALRFVQSAYENNKNATESNGYAKIWKEIEKRVIKLGEEEKTNDEIVKYAPASCSEAYSKEYMKNAFIINPRGLSKSDGSAFVNDDSLKETITYPRLVFNDDALVQAEGIYIIAVGDKETTDMVGGTKDKASAFYDFYIRSCWYGINSDEPSTISTVIRLYNPDAIEVVQPEVAVNINFQNEIYSYDENCGKFPPQKIKYGGTITFPAASCFSLKDKDNNSAEITLLGWSKNSKSKNPEYKPGKSYTIQGTKSLNLYPIWGDTDLSFWVDLNTFIDEKNSNTSGREGFNADIIINGTKVKSDVIDFYEEVKLGANVEIVLKGVNGYRLTNSESLCSEVKGCKIRFENGNYIITFGITEESISDIINSTGRNAINIEPIWTKE